MNYENKNLKKFFEKLEIIFGDMDDKYNQTAGHYRFDCKGCEDNCCQTRFYHFTHLEYLYLKAGLETLSPEQRKAAVSRARKVAENDLFSDKEGVSKRMMCPLNVSGLCILYHHRPMICRLHGIPSELKIPPRGTPGGQNPKVSSGCDTFHQKFGGQTYYPFDRTPFYKKMAGLEQELKAALGLTQKIRMTVSEILIHR